jgi:hypothetical protein
MWDHLKQHGVYQAIQQMRGRYKEEYKALKKKREDDEEQQRSSEQAMADAEKHKTRKPYESVERQRKAQELLRREIFRRAEESGVSTEQVERELLTEIQGNPYKVTQMSLPGAPFFSVAQIGGQKVLNLNTAHRFYTDVYAGPESTPRLRAAIEVLLFVIGECELDADDERQLFYETERGEWSSRLRVALDRLDRIDSAEDDSLVSEDDTEGVADTAVAAGSEGS